MLSPLKQWSEVSDLIEANCTIAFKVADGTVTNDPETGNAIFSQREITVRAYVYEDDVLANKGVKDSTVGVDAAEKQLVAMVASVSDPLNPGLPQNLLPPSIADMAACFLTFDYPTGLKRTGAGTIRIEQLDIYNVHETLGEMFYIRFIPDRRRRA